MKIASDREGEPVEPGLRPPAAADAALTAGARLHRPPLPGARGTPIRSAPSCHYSLTADGNFLFARHPERASVWLLGGGSGHGYKHGPMLVGARGGRALRVERRPTPASRLAHERLARPSPAGS